MKKYSAELKAQVISEYHQGRSVSALARDFEPSYHTIQTWVRTADQSGSSQEESIQDELKRLRREQRELLEDKAILKKANAWFAERNQDS